MTGALIRSGPARRFAEPGHCPLRGSRCRQQLGAVLVVARALSVSRSERVVRVQEPHSEAILELGDAFAQR